jgi:hypothetical protein
MDAVPPANSPIIAAFVARTPGSAAAYAGARHHFPGGVTRDARDVRPPPLAVARAAGEGSRRWAAEGALVGRRNLIELRDTDAMARTPMPPICAPR